MAYKRGKKHSSKRKMTVPLALAAPIALIGANAYQQYTSGGFASVKKYTLMAMAGKDGNDQLNMGTAVNFYLPILAGAAIHIGASKLGVNRMIANARVPFIRI